MTDVTLVNVANTRPGPKPKIVTVRTNERGPVRAHSPWPTERICGVLFSSIACPVPVYVAMDRKLAGRPGGGFGVVTFDIQVPSIAILLSSDPSASVAALWPSVAR